MNLLTTSAFWKMREMAFPSCFFHFSCEVVLEVISRTIILDTMQRLCEVHAHESSIYQDKKASNKTAQEIFKSVHLPYTVLLAIILSTNNTSYPSPGASFGGYTPLRVWLSKSISQFYITRIFPMTFVHFKLALLKWNIQLE